MRLGVIWLLALVGLAAAHADTGLVLNGQDRNSLLYTVSSFLLPTQGYENRFVFTGKGQSFSYSMKLQPGSQPEERDLVVVLPGFGADHRDNKAIYLANQFYESGSHVVVLDSPAGGRYLFYSSYSGVPGIMDEEAKDVSMGLSAILDQLKWYHGHACWTKRLISLIFKKPFLSTPL